MSLKHRCEQSQEAVDAWPRPQLHSCKMIFSKVGAKAKRKKEKAAGEFKLLGLHQICQMCKGL